MQVEQVTARKCVHQLTPVWGRDLLGMVKYYISSMNISTKGNINIKYSCNIYISFAEHGIILSGGAATTIMFLIFLPSKYNIRRNVESTLIFMQQFPDILTQKNQDQRSENIQYHTISHFC